MYVLRLLLVAVLVALAFADYDDLDAEFTLPLVKKGRPQGPMRFGKRKAGPSGPMRFGKRSSHEDEELHFRQPYYFLI